MKELVLIGGILGFAGFVISLICVAMIAGFTRSTHTVQYAPYDNNLPDTKSDEQLARENEAALLNAVGPKKKKEVPTVVEDLDKVIEDINQTDIQF